MAAFCSSTNFQFNEAFRGALGTLHRGSLTLLPWYHRRGCASNLSCTLMHLIAHYAAGSVPKKKVFLKRADYTVEFTWCLASVMRWYRLKKNTALVFFLFCFCNNIVRKLETGPVIVKFAFVHNNINPASALLWPLLCLCCSFDPFHCIVDRRKASFLNPPTSRMPFVIITPSVLTLILFFTQ